MSERTKEEVQLIELGAASELTQGAESDQVEQIILLKRQVE